MTCQTEAWLKVAEIAGHEANLIFMFDATNCEHCKQAARLVGREAPGRITYNVRANAQGQVLSFDRQGTASGGQKEARQVYPDESILKLTCRQLLGEGLHDRRLETGKTYDVAWLHPEEWHRAAADDSPGRSSSSSRAAGEEEPFPRTGAGSLALRYDGFTLVRDLRVAHFTAVRAGGSFSSTATGNAGTSAAAGRGENEVGLANFRLEDGFLEKFGLVLPSSFFNSQGKESRQEAGASGDVLITVRRTE
jgi:hypothetical protein